jgi:probable F420-dependent oxidoreductase
MRIGLLVPMFGELCDIALLREFAVSAEAQGFDSLWVGDHVVLPKASTSEYAYIRSKKYASERGEQARSDRWDAAATLAFLAAMTSRVTLGTSVYLAPYRHPLISAKAFSSIDVMSGGRLEVGVGSGWLAEEFAALGVPFSERGSRTDEVLAVWQQAWTTPAGGLIDHVGKHFRIEGVSMEPVPVRGHIPVAIGGHSRATRRRIVEHRAGWHAVTEEPGHCYGWSEDFGEAIAQLTDAWQQRWEDGTSPEITGVIIDGPASQPADLVDMCATYEKVGVSRLILDFPSARSANGTELMAMLDLLGRTLPLSD